MASSLRNALLASVVSLSSFTCSWKCFPTNTFASCHTGVTTVTRPPQSSMGPNVHLSWCCVLNHLSRVWVFATPWTVARQAPLSTGFSRQEYWSAWPCPPPGDLPFPGIKPASLMSPTLAGRFFTWVSFPSWPAQTLSAVALILDKGCRNTPFR